MCGIAGILSRAPLTPVDRERARAVNARLRHRGPDGEGCHDAEHVLLAMRRLSIIDLETGWQPLYNEDRSLALVANGEVYNYIELRETLRARGHQFATGSDCETILHAYEEYGDRFATQLRGMYAFALWDSRRRRLILGRDRMGEKPLYLVERDGSLLFASELRALVHSGVVPFRLDPAAVNLYYHYRYVPEPHCMVAGVRKLPAAHLLTVDVDTWSLRESCYWRMEDAPAIEGDPGRVIREELERTGELVTRADVPIGVALSGGLDASAVAALAVRARGRGVHAFTVGYTGTPWQDERAEARAFAEHLGIPHHEVELSPRDLVERYPAMHGHRDDPISDGAGVGIEAIAQAARRHGVPVLLFGQGGDELFWGYQWLRRALQWTRRRQALAAGMQGLKAYLHLSPPPFSLTLGLQWALSGAGMLPQWRQFRADRHATPGRLVFYESEPFFARVTRELRQPFFTDQFTQSIGEPDLTMDFVAHEHESKPELALIRLICATYLRENGIAQSDRLSMAASIESRLPLVDYRLVETVIGLHKSHTLPADAAPKQWFRDALEGLLPDFVMRRRKRGFSPPWRAWAREIADAFGDQLIDGYLVQNGVLRPEAAKRQRRGLYPPPTGPRPLAGSSLDLEIWCRQLSAGV